MFRADRDEYIDFNIDPNSVDYEKNYGKLDNRKWVNFGEFDRDTMESKFKMLNKLYNGIMSGSNLLNNFKILFSA